MITISIKHEAENISNMVVTLRHIANLIEEGNTSGYYPTWEIEDQSKRKSDIDYIQKTLSEWGETTSCDLELLSSPVYNNVNGTICSLVERFNQNNVTVITYDGENVINEVDIPYSELSDELIDEIKMIIQEYEAGQLKTEKRISNE